MGADAAGPRSEGRRGGLESARLGAADRQDPPRPAAARDQPPAEQARADIGPQVADEYLYRVVDALDEVARETGKTVPQIALNWLLQRPTVANVIIGARNEEQLRQNLGAVGWNLTPEQVATLDAASATTLAYPYWHQRGFAERNPPPVRGRHSPGHLSDRPMSAIRGRPEFMPKPTACGRIDAPTAAGTRPSIWVHADRSRSSKRKHPEARNLAPGCLFIQMVGESTEPVESRCGLSPIS